MATERINTIVKEVIELDPSLREHEASLRTFIERMDEVRPNVAIDALFIASLRRRILSEGRTPSPYASISWWALRLMPIGAVALLLLMIVQPTPYTSEPRSIPEMISSDPRILDIEIGGTQNVAPQVEQYGIGAASDVSTESAPSMELKSMVANQEVAPFSIQPQRPGQIVEIDTLTVAESGFLIIFSKTTAGETVIGTSSLLPQGTVEDLTINLRTPMVIDGAYRAALYQDNGDQLFTSDDQTGYDIPGKVMSAPITFVTE